MNRIKHYRNLLPGILKLLGLLIPLSIITGLLVALFLWLLDYVTTLRFANPWLIFLLPAGGILIAFLYKFAGGNIERGNVLIIDAINRHTGAVPGRITPVILVTTLITHLSGGSAGREGTAVQMGGGIAGFLCKRFSVGPGQQRLMLICGMAAGFGAVFGTPLAGAVFAIEVLKVGNLKYNDFVYCLIASVIGDLCCRFTGLEHTIYLVEFVPNLTGNIRWVSGNLTLLLEVILAGCIFGCASRLYVWSLHTFKSGAALLIPRKILQPVIGACLVIAITLLIGNQDYLGLGVVNPKPDGVSILSSFHAGGADYFSWVWKMLLTVITLSFGFKGGEVTPLFFIGATLGNVLALITGAPVDIFAAMGFIAVFAGATNTPIACTIMGVELFGSDNFIFFGVSCLAAFLCSGSKSIYASQQPYERG